MTMTDSPIRNGVDTATLFATIDAVKAQPEAAHFQFRVSNSWISGTHSEAMIETFFGVGEERRHARPTVLDFDHPEVLVGHDNGPTPVEYVLAGLAACLTAGIANIAAARKIELTKVQSTVEGDIDLNGILGTQNVRNGFQAVRVHFEVEGKASREDLAKLVEQSLSRSAVYDIVTNGVPVTVDVDARSGS
jgi:uncharacterized OsmC-like protein